MLTLNALMAAGEAVVPVEPSLYSLHGLARLTELVKLLTARSGHEIRLQNPRQRFRWPLAFRARDARGDPPHLPRRNAGIGDQIERPCARSGGPRSAGPSSRPRRADRGRLRGARRRAGAPRAGRLAATGAQKSPGFVVTREGVYITRHDVPPEGVRVAGDWGGWEPDSGVRLELHEDGGSTKFVPLGPGLYEYKLVVDGRWIPDPLNPRRIPDSVGSVNSVLEIEG